MARKRASMREGPLAELFRATEAAQRQAEGEPEQTPAPAEAGAAPVTEPDERTVDHVPSWEESARSEMPAPPAPPTPRPDPSPSPDAGSSAAASDSGSRSAARAGTASDPRVAPADGAAGATRTPEPWPGARRAGAYLAVIRSSASAAPA